MKRFYITTAIPLVNAKPHIGFALEIVQTDAIARYQRLFGRQVRFLTGSDENSLKNVQTAESEGIGTAELVARNAKYFACFALRPASTAVSPAPFSTNFNSPLAKTTTKSLFKSK